MKACCRYLNIAGFHQLRILDVKGATDHTQATSDPAQEHEPDWMPGCYLVGIGVKRR